MKASTKRMVFTRLVALFVFLGIFCLALPHFVLFTTKESGHYIRKGFGDTFHICHLAYSDKVIYQLEGDCIYLLGENAGENGASYGNILVPSCDYKLLKASGYWMVFKDTEGQIVAIEIAESYDEHGNIYHETIPYRDLSFFDKWQLQNITKVELFVNWSEMVEIFSI